MQAFPIGFWNYAPVRLFDAACVRDWADAGMTLAMSPEFGPDPGDTRRMLSILDAAAERNIRVILCHAHGYAQHATWDEAVYRQRFAACVETYGAHPAVFGFHVGDEPDTRDFSRFSAAMRIQKELAPHLSPFGNLLPLHPGFESRVGHASWAAYLDAYCAAARPDFLCYDCYCQMSRDAENLTDDGFDLYFRNLREYSEAGARHGIPYWTTVLSVGHFRLRRPTEDDFRWQLNTAVAHGAKGILYFFLYMREPHGNYRVPPIDEHYERTETYAWLSRVNRTFHKTVGPVFAGLELRAAYHSGKTYGGFAEPCGTGRILRAEGGPLVVSEFVRPCDGAEFVAVVNNSQTENIEAKVWIRGRRPAAHRIGWMGEEVEHVGGATQAGRCGEDYCRPSHWLGPGQMELYRVADEG